MNALKYQAFSIEADLYLRNGQLVVAHEKKDIMAATTFDSLYLQPILRLFKKHPGRISKSKNYAPVLMIDIKESGEAVLVVLIQLLAEHLSVFDRSEIPWLFKLLLVVIVALHQNGHPIHRLFYLMAGLMKCMTVSRCNE